LTEESWAVHGGNRPDVSTGAIRTPIVLANSYELPQDPSTLDESDPDVLVYTRESGANQLGLQTKLAALEHGEAAAVFGTGMAALHATFFTLLNPGDHAIVSNVRRGSSTRPRTRSVKTSWSGTSTSHRPRNATAPTVRVP
jgi:methionine-gamma-lyase